MASERPDGGGDTRPGHLSTLQRLILQYLRDRGASYARPVSSTELGQYLNITDSYAREQTRPLVLRGLVAVRGGPKGGYYLPDLPPGPRA